MNWSENLYVPASRTSSARPCGAAKASPSKSTPILSFIFQLSLKLIMGTKPTFFFEAMSPSLFRAISASLIFAVKPKPNSIFTFLQYHIGMLSCMN